MHSQPNLFSPFTDTATRQPMLFADYTTSDKDCPVCRELMVFTPSGFLCCPRGHGRLRVLEELQEGYGAARVAEKANREATETAAAYLTPDGYLPAPVEAAMHVADLHAERCAWLGDPPCECGMCRLTRATKGE